jgi:hydrogen peroxide-dependent heme synthase
MAVEPLGPARGWGVLHLFWKTGSSVDRESVIAAVKSLATEDDYTVITVAVLGHQADLCTLVLGPDLWRLRRFQSEIASAGLELVDSYVSITEASEYAAGIPEEMLRGRYYPTVPPEGMRAFCFYPMSKRRGIGKDDNNWFRLPFDERKTLMHEHGISGRKFAGRIVQMVTGSTGLDQFEWGVTLFAHDPADLKEVVYTMRFDEASAIYGEFGQFIVGMIAEVDDVLASLGR